MPTSDTGSSGYRSRGSSPTSFYESTSVFSTFELKGHFGADRAVNNVADSSAGMQPPLDAYPFMIGPLARFFSSPINPLSYLLQLVFPFYADWRYQVRTNVNESLK